MKKIIARIALIALLLAPIVPTMTAQAATPNWDVTGSWKIDYSLDGVNYDPSLYDLTLTQNGSNLTGMGQYPSPGPYAFAWTVVGTVSGDTVNLTDTYTLGAIGTVMHMTGTVAPDGTMSGTWDDNYTGGRTGTWKSVSGSGLNTCSTMTVVSSPSTQFKGLTTIDPSGFSSTGLFSGGISSAVVADSVGFPGAWSLAASDPGVAGASWVNNSAVPPSNPSDVVGGDGTVNSWRLFSQGFTLPAGAVVSSANLHMSGDNSVQAFLDNVSVGSALSYTAVDNFPLVVTPGTHELEFVVKNDAYDGVTNPTGVIYRADINYCVPIVPTSASVHIFKYLDGTHATAVSAHNTNFPMLTTFTSTTYGNYSNVPFTLGTAGWGSDPAYEASFPNANIGASYSAWEDTSGPLVSTSCDGIHPYALQGYSVGTTLGQAQSATSTLAVPAFLNLTGDEYVIVRNVTCQVAPLIKVHILKYLDGEQATALNVPGGYQFPMVATWQTSNLNGGVSTSGNYVLGNYHGGVTDKYAADTAPMAVPANYATSEITDATSQVVSNIAACTPGKYVLNGYKMSEVSFANAKTKALNPVAPAYTNLKSDRYVIVYNSKCPTTGTISGMKYNDLNRNGKKDPNEPGLQGWVIRLLLDGPNDKNTLVATTTTDASGNYTFLNVTPGTYDVRETHQKGWKRQSKNPKDIVIVAGSNVTDVMFGNALTKKGEKEDTTSDDDQNDQSGKYYANHGNSDYGHDQDSKDHDHSDTEGKDKKDKSHGDN